MRIARSLSVTALMLVVLLGYQYFFKPKTTDPTTTSQAQVQATAPASAQPATDATSC